MTAARIAAWLAPVGTTQNELACSRQRPRGARSGSARARQALVRVIISTVFAAGLSIVVDDPDALAKAVGTHERRGR
jgi:hypothetical protein